MKKVNIAADMFIFGLVALLIAIILYLFVLENEIEARKAILGAGFLGAVVGGALVYRFHVMGRDDDEDVS